jgi:hypothetical protein
VGGHDKKNERRKDGRRKGEIYRGREKKKEAKKLSSTRQCLAKKRSKVRIQMQGGMTGMWEGHLLQVISCTETNRKAFFLVAKPKPKSNKKMSAGAD